MGNGEAKIKNNPDSDYSRVLISYRLPATGIIALDGGMITFDDFQKAMNDWQQLKKSGAHVSFEDILVKKKLISPEIMTRLIPATIRKLSLEFGNILIEKGWVSNSYIKKALSVQAEKFKSGELMLLSDFLIKAGLLSEEKRDLIYEIQDKKTIEWLRENRKTARFSEPKKNSKAPEPPKTDTDKIKNIQAERTLGELAVTYGFITNAQLEKGIEIFKKAVNAGKMLSLAEIMRKAGFLSDEDSERLIKTDLFLKTRDLDSVFAAIAVKEGLLNKDDAQESLRLQSAAFEKNNEITELAVILIENNSLDKELCIEILESQNRKLPEKLQDKRAIPETEYEFSEAEDYNSSEIAVNIGHDNLFAEMIIPAQYPAPLGPLDIRENLNQRNIISGIIPDKKIYEFLATDISGARRFTVAKGIPAVPGKDGELILHFPREYLNPGKETKDGKMDFRNRGEVPFVEKGALLVEIIPKKEGTAGLDIFGTEIPPPPVEGVTATSGPGTRMDKSRLKIYADEDGQPAINMSGEVSVLQEFRVNGDVDYSTGNISFNGHIIVRGSVKEGFVVKGGTLTAKSIDGGRVDLTGNLEISSGIVNAIIQVEGNIQAMYVSESVIESYSDIIIKKEILYSDIKTSGAIVGDSLVIVGSSVSAMKGIDVGRIGTEVSEPCVLRIGTNAHTEKVINEHREQIEELKKKIEEKQAAAKALEKEYKELTELVTGTANTQEMAQERLREMEEKDPDGEKSIREIEQLKGIISESEDSISHFFKNQEALAQKEVHFQEICDDYYRRIENLKALIKGVRSWLKTQVRVARIHAVKEIHAGTSISGPETMMEIKTACKHCSIVETTEENEEGERVPVMKIIQD